VNATPELIRILIVDDHPVVRAGLRTVSEVDEQIVIVGEAASAGEARVAVRALNPDALLLDVRLPDQSGLELCRELKDNGPAPRILFVTSYADNALVLTAMQAGGDGYLLKDNEPSDIAAALRKVMAGGAVFDPVAARLVVAGMQNATAPALNGLQLLSAQELKVLAAVSLGHTDKEVAQSLGLQTKTARNYLERVFQKLGVNTRTQAAILYDRHLRER
jgi:two-component system response regulator DevR